MGEVKHSHLLKTFDYMFICQKYVITRRGKQYKENTLLFKGLEARRNMTIKTVCPFQHTYGL